VRLPKPVSSLLPIFAHLNRPIQHTGANVIYLTGPGHGGPAIVANVYLEGTYSEIYPHISQDTVGLRRLFRQFSTPGGIPSHASVQTPGSINSHKGFLSESELQETSDSPKDWPDSYCCGTAKSFADAGGPLQKTPEAER
jgi:xylulose-5-phosphate/fructose-6-phosphate phosphoketolase